MGFLERALGQRIRRELDEQARDRSGRRQRTRARRQLVLTETARALAASDRDDPTASARLRSHLPRDRTVARDAIDDLAERRTSYLDDRAYRLLTAAVDGTPVRPIDPAVASQFAAEAELGRLSLSDAFAALAVLEPRLRDASRQADDTLLVGPWASGPHAVLNTELAAGIVREYAAATRDGRAPEADPTPVFERLADAPGESGALFGRDDNRPRARN